MGSGPEERSGLRPGEGSNSSMGAGFIHHTVLMLQVAAALAASLGRYTPLVRFDIDSAPQQDWGQQIRFKHLYVEGNNKHLQINPDGHIDSSHTQNFYTLVEIKAVERGQVVIRGVRTGRYLCMDAWGHIFGSTTYREDDCNFNEEQLETFYNVYHSPRHKKVLSLSVDKHPYNPDREMPPLSMFLPRENELPTPTHSRRAPELVTNDPFQMRSVQQASSKQLRVSRG